MSGPVCFPKTLYVTAFFLMLCLVDDFVTQFEFLKTGIHKSAQEGKEFSHS